MIPSAGSSTPGQKKIYIWAAIALIIGAIILLFLFLRHPKNIASQAAPAGNSVQSRSAQTGSHTGITQIERDEKTYQALRDQPRPSDQPAAQQAPRYTGNSSRTFVENPIRSIALNVRFTYETESGAVFPPEVPFVPLGDANDTNAYLEGAGGAVRLDFIGPVRFEVLDDRHVAVINNFFLRTSPDSYWSEVESLKTFDSISVPIVVAGYEGSLKTMISYSCHVEVKGRRAQAWGYSSKPTEQGGATIRIPIVE